MKDKAIIFGWIVGLLLLLSMVWILSQPIQKRYLLMAVNSVLSANGDTRRVTDYKGVNDGKTGLFGYWFLLNNSTKSIFVFAVFQDGILVPLGAVVSDNGSVEDVVPLSAHAAQISDKLPASVLQLYITRIETAALANKRGNR